MISLVTGTINRLRLLKRLVESVRSSVGDLEYEIVIVDNNSTDGTREWLLEQPDVVYINIGEPRGSAPAFQLGFESCSPQSEYVVTMNDDIAIDGDTIVRAARYLDNHPEVGQVAFGHKYQNRKGISGTAPIIQKAYGYVYGQCCMTRKWLGDFVRWCGPDEGYISYGWDNRLSMAIWNLGYKVVPLDGCTVTDWEFEDATRKKFADDMKKGGKPHPDTVRFAKHWKDRLPHPSQWKSAMDLTTRLVHKIIKGNCRVLRFKAMMAANDHMRTACIDALAAWGPAKQINMDAMIQNVGHYRFQQRAVQLVEEYKPDFVMMQAQRPNNILPETMQLMKEKYPDTFFFNWDGDTHYPLETFHYQAAMACHLQGLISPTMFPDYVLHGVPNVCYWPIGVEDEFLQAVRDPNKLHGPDVLFLGSLYGQGKFPEANTRRDAVVALHRHNKVDFDVYGYGWNKVGIKTTITSEKFDVNPRLYTQCKMSLCISQTKEMWGYSSDRLYNVCATGCPALVQRFNGMEEHGFVDGETCIAWDTIPEMLDKAGYYSLHHTEREEIGAAGREVVHSRHTWPHRVNGLLAMLEGMDNYEKGRSC